MSESTRKTYPFFYSDGTLRRHATEGQPRFQIPVWVAPPATYQEGADARTAAKHVVLSFYLLDFVVGEASGRMCVEDGMSRHEIGAAIRRGINDSN